MDDELVRDLWAGRFTEWRERMAGETPERVGAALLQLVRNSRQARPPIEYYWNLRETVAAVLRRPFTVSAEEAESAARFVAKGTNVDSFVTLRIAETMARHSGSITAARTVLAALDQQEDGLSTDERAGIRARLISLLPTGTGRADLSLIVDVDGWAKAVRRELAGEPEADLVTALLRHLVTATGSKPGKKWIVETAQLLENPAAARVLRVLLERVADAEPLRVKHILFGARVPVVLDERNADLVRAAAWAAAQVNQPWVVPALVAIWRREADPNEGVIASKKVPNAAVLALGLVATTEAVSELVKLEARTRDNGDRKRIAAALEAAGAANGLTPGQVAERLVDPAGFTAEGIAELERNGVGARAVLADDLTITLRWRNGEDWTAKPPPEAEESAVKAIKRQVTEKRAAVAAEKRRVEGLFAVDREWSLADWRRYYLAHPITGRIAARLIWRIGEHTGIPVAGRLSTVDGEIDLPEGPVRLWHPARASTAEVAAWRAQLLETELRQPFKQAFREVYLLTEAERVTETYSNRFAAHILHYNQAYALFKERGWTANYLGPYDGGYEGRARREFRDAGLTALFEHFPAEDNPRAAPELCSTDRVWFHRTGDRGKTPLPLDEVPPLVFTEAMRDVDLFIGVASIALDPNWADRGENPHFAYWHQVSFGELSARAQVRRDALAALLPKLAVAHRAELLDRFVRVRGQLATYKIHLGSANVLVEPDDRYLCIVPARGKGSRVLLPFEGDELLSVILSKVLLLARDDKITDPGITSQLAFR